MKETKQAKENVGITKKKLVINKGICKSHKQTCQRWLGEDKKELNILENLTFFDGDRENVATLITNKRNKIKDKEQAIKVYNEAGI